MYIYIERERESNGGSKSKLPCFSVFITALFRVPDLGVGCSGASFLAASVEVEAAAKVRGYQGAGNLPVTPITYSFTGSTCQ